MLEQTEHLATKGCECTPRTASASFHPAVWGKKMIKQIKHVVNTKFWSVTLTVSCSLISSYETCSNPCMLIQLVEKVVNMVRVGKRKS